MSTARHIIALLKSYAEGQEQQFHSAALQMAAHEARLGHRKLAQEIKAIVEQAKASRSDIIQKKGPVPLVQPKGELASILSAGYPNTRLSDMVLPHELESRLSRILTEQRQRNRLGAYNLSPRRKILLVGPPGAGKTMSASALAGELQLPIFTIIYSSLIGKYMGETASRLKLVFDSMANTRGVYFFDEFDAIGTQRSNVNDVGEIRRILNSFLLFIENDESESLIVAATNHPNLLDPALFRRFDDVLEYQLPSREMVRRLVEKRLGMFTIQWKSWEDILKASQGLSPADIIRASDEAAKQAVLFDTEKVSKQSLIKAISERKNIDFEKAKINS
ncbi:ATP-binding protein [Leptolyngbya cf. ectocarpi LEGE 11479]|uniref:ATP-binding protein n=1 Tax=Leptolyngbya cf. ectocarpi LEGE 11479 TaxID=1828722 RepID=A0A928ZZ91_LEPEC|nr:ATP-binding protein [Leptolyngbya ectocarpi]MBE9070153.1 ATP-binding protein [Leptolyngbya cf. ectocarpi LEGE 11479]